MDTALDRGGVDVIAGVIVLIGPAAVIDSDVCQVPKNKDKGC